MNTACRPKPEYRHARHDGSPEMVVEVATREVSVHDGASCGRLLAWLDGEECERVAGLASPNEARLYIAAHALARSALSAAGGGDPSGWSFVREPDGKPRARDAGGGPGPSFSLAHAHAVPATPSSALVGMVGVAITRHAPWQVGFDLEGHDPTLHPQELAQVLSARQSAAIAALPVAHRPAALVRLWSMKEAYAKATGRGLGADLSAIEFDGGGCGPNTERAREAPDVAWRCVHRRLPHGFSAALAVKGPARLDLQVRWRRRTASSLAAGAMPIMSLPTAVASPVSVPTVWVPWPWSSHGSCALARPESEQGP